MTDHFNQVPDPPTGANTGAAEQPGAIRGDGSARRYRSADQATPNAALADLRARGRRAGVITLGLSLLSLAVASVIAFTWLPDLPSPLATHWDAAGVVNGTSSFTSLITLLWLIGVVVAGGLSSWTFLSVQVASTRRVLSGVVVGTNLFLAATMIGTLWIQRGLSDAYQAGPLDDAITLALIIALVGGAAVGLLLPGDPPLAAAGPLPTATVGLDLGPSERAVWITRLRPRHLIWLPIFLNAAMITTFVATRLWLFGVVVLIVLNGLCCGLMCFTLRIDASGLTLRSAIDWPKLVIPADEVEWAEVTQIHPLRDYGGWGWRVGRDGRVGVILGRGEALVVHRSGQRRVDITVSDAATAAALLNTYAAQARPHR